MSGENVEIKDLGSKNGIYLNGKKIDQSSFGTEDEIAIGDSILRILKEQEGKLIFAQDETSEIDINNVIIRSPKAISETEGLGIGQFDKMIQDEWGWKIRTKKSHDLEFLLKRNFQLHRFIRILNSVTELDKLMEMILDEIMKMVNAERGFLMLRDTKTDVYGIVV